MGKLLYFIFIGLFFCSSASSQNFQLDLSEINSVSIDENGKYIIDSTSFSIGNTLGQSWFNHKIFRPESYNDRGDLLIAYDYEFDTINFFWYKQRFYEGQYYLDGLRRRWLSFVFDLPQGNWRMSDSIHFNQAGKPVTSWYKSWDPIKAKFVVGKRSSYFYDNNARLHIQYNQTLDTATQAWKRTNYELYYYTNRNLDSLKLVFAYNNASQQWLDSLKVSYLHNDNQLLTEEIRLVFDAGIWKNFQRWEYSYNQTGNLMLRNEYAWEDNTGQWISKNQSVYEYNDLQLLKTRTDFLWDGIEWLNRTRVSYQYNSDGLIAEVLNQYWSFGFGIWANASLSTYTYDENLNRKVFSFYTWNPMLEAWRNFYREENFWSFFESSSIDVKTFLSLNIYPNPSQGEMRYSFNTQNQNHGRVQFFFYDVAGRLAKTLETHGSSGTLNVSDLKSGTYTMIYTTAGETGSTLFIKK